MKTCPRCQNLVFDDMQQCFECLYVFPQSSSSPLAQAPINAVNRVISQASNQPGERAVISDQPPASSQTPVVMQQAAQLTVQTTALPHAESSAYLNTQSAAHPPEQPAIKTDAVMAENPGACLSERPTALHDLDTVVEQKHCSQAAPLVYIDDGTSISFVSFTRKDLSIGRGLNCDVVIPLPTVSRDHLRLYWEGGKVYAEDRKAANPSTILGQPLRSCVEIEYGDIIEIQGVKIGLKSPVQ